jgi:hypothetical protein
MPTNDLWPDDAFKDLGVIPPVEILREQANALTERTRGALRGLITSSSSGGDVIHTLHIHVPSLGYSIAILGLTHDPTLIYPATLKIPIGKAPQAPEDMMLVTSDQALRADLRVVFASDRVVRIVRNLLAQVEHKEPGP